MDWVGRMTRDICIFDQRHDEQSQSVTSVSLIKDMALFDCAKRALLTIEKHTQSPTKRKTKSVPRSAGSVARFCIICRTF